MYYGKKKGIIIAIVVLVLVMVLGVVGFFLLSKTDMFKSNEEAFFKYIGQTLESLQFVENEQLTDIQDLKKEMPYITQGILTCTTDNKDLKMLENLKVILNSTTNPNKESTYAKIDFINNNNNIFNIEYANTKNIYGLKSNEIVTAFIGVENSNLKVLAQKLGVTDTTIIPDSLQINNFNINELFLISEQEKQYILENYMPIITQNVTNNNFSKSNDLTINRDGIDYNTTEYRLELSDMEVNQLEIAILEELTEDSQALNLLATKAKILGLDENFTQVNNLVSNIKNLIQNLKSGTVQNTGITINVYVAGGKTISTEIILNNDIKLTIYGESLANKSNCHFIMETFASSEFKKLELDMKEIRNEGDTSFNLLFNIDNKTGINLSIENIGSADSKKINTNYEVILNQKDTETIFNYEEETNFKEEVPTYVELDRTNCGVLNDYTKEQLETLLQALSTQITNVINQKLQLISSSNQTNNLQTTNSNQTNTQESTMQNTTTNEQQSQFQGSTQSYVDSMSVNGEMYENPRAVQ